MNEKKRIADMDIGDCFVFDLEGFDYDELYVVGSYDESDNTYYVYEYGDVRNGMFVNANKIVIYKGRDC